MGRGVAGGNMDLFDYRGEKGCGCRFMLQHIGYPHQRHLLQNEKAGQVLSHEEMQNLIRQLERCQSPHTCPHGRPTMIHLSSDQLAREFGRM